MVHCREDFAGAAALSAVALCLQGTVQAQHVTTWTTRPVSHLQLSRWFFFASPAQVNGHFGFWSILGVLSGIGALIIGITYLICRFKKPTNQVADRDQNMVEDNFVHTDVRTVLYPDNHLEHQRLQPAPVVRLEHNRPPYYGAAAHHSPPSAVATSAVPDASTSMPTPLTTASTAVGNCSRLNQLCLETWTGFDPIDIKNTSASRQPSGGLSNINSGRQAQLKPTVVHSAIARSAVKFNCVSNFLTVKPKRTSVDV